QPAGTSATVSVCCALYLPVVRRMQESRVPSSTLSRTLLLYPSGGQPSHTGQCCEAESPLPTLAFSKHLHLLRAAPASRTAAMVDRTPPAACGVEQPLSSRSFYGGVVQRPWVSKACA